MYHPAPMMTPTAQHHFLQYTPEDDEVEDVCSPAADIYLHDWPEYGSKLYCNNRCLIGPDDWFNGLPRTVAMMIIPAIFLIPWGVRIAWKLNRWPLFAVVVILLPVTLTLLWLVSCMDPGFIPPQRIQDPEEGNPQVWKFGRMLQDMIVEEKWDKNAKVYRPLRTKYDTMSEFNVERFDHWCNWVSNAIGLRNHRLFLLFLISINLQIISCTMLCYNGLRIYDSVEEFFLSFSSVLKPNGLALLGLLLYFPAFFVFTSWLFLKQSLYICTNQTTSEALKPFQRAGKPFSRGCCNNCMEFWFKQECFIPSYIFHPAWRQQYNEQHAPDQIDTWIGPNLEGEGTQPAHGEDFHIAGRVLEEEEYGEDKRVTFDQRTVEGYVSQLEQMGAKALVSPCCLAQVQQQRQQKLLNEKIGSNNENQAKASSPKHKKVTESSTSSTQQPSSASGTPGGGRYEMQQFYAPLSAPHQYDMYNPYV
eukprot:Filipodium_phascolosomae@DN8344_c0_g1_i1.p1